jgi:hypothetical protein
MGVREKEAAKDEAVSFPSQAASGTGADCYRLILTAL